MSDETKKRWLNVEAIGERWRRTSAPSPVLTIVYLVTIATVIWVWAPWRDGSEDRVTSSGLIAVLTLVVVQLGTTAIQARSQDQAVAVRRLELEHQRENDTIARREAERAQGVAAKRDALRELGMAIVEVTPVLVDMEIQEENTHAIVWPTQSMARLSAAIFVFRSTYQDLKMSDFELDRDLNSIESTVRQLNTSATIDTQRSADRRFLIALLGATVSRVGQFRAGGSQD